MICWRFSIQAKLKLYGELIHSRKKIYPYFKPPPVRSSFATAWTSILHLFPIVSNCTFHLIWARANKKAQGSWAGSAWSCLVQSSRFDLPNEPSQGFHTEHSFLLYDLSFLLPSKPTACLELNHIAAGNLKKLLKPHTRPLGVNNFFCFSQSEHDHHHNDDTGKSSAWLHSLHVFSWITAATSWSTASVGAVKFVPLYFSWRRKDAAATNA